MTHSHAVAVTVELGITTQEQTVVRNLSVVERGPDIIC